MKPSQWYVRLPLKVAVFSIVTLFVLFPSPAQLLRHLSHLGNLEAMVDPEAPELAEWEREIRKHLEAWASARMKSPPGSEAEFPDGGGATTSEAPPAAVQGWIEGLVTRKIEYAWDWDVWGAADYMPTVGEMFARAEGSEDGRLREDCDGRAVMAASLMRRFGYQSSIVTDLRHVWVITPEGEWMGPGRNKTIESSSSGNRTSIAATLGNVPVALSYGIAVFPLWRELIILATAAALVCHRRMPRRAIALGGLLILQGLLFMRLGFFSPGGVSEAAHAWPAWVGAGHLVAGFAILQRFSYRARGRGTRT